MTPYQKTFWTIFAFIAATCVILFIGTESSDEEAEYQKWRPDDTLPKYATRCYSEGNFKIAWFVTQDCLEANAVEPVCESINMELDLYYSAMDTDSLARLEKLAQVGNPHVQYLHGVLLSNKYDNITEYTSGNYPLSVLSMYAASVGRDHGALMAMGYRHWKGYGVPKKCETAAMNYLEVAQSVAKIYANTIPRAVELIRLTVENDRHQLSVSEIELYLTLARENADLALAVGKRFLLGSDGFPQDFEKAREFFTLIAYNDSVDDGEDYLSLDASDPERIGKKRKSTLLSALALLGYMEILGLDEDGDVSTRMTIAERLFTLSQSDSLGMNGLGYIRFKQENFTEAFSWFTKSADAGSADGMFNLGSMYLTGTGVVSDFRQAFMWYTEALRRGHTPAGYALAVMHLNGLGTVRDCDTAVTLLKEVAERGDWVNTNLRASYALLRSGDKFAAAFPLLKLAEAGHLVSQENLAHLFETSEAVFIVAPSTDEKAVYAQRLLEMAADQGSIVAFNKLGDLAFYGQGIQSEVHETEDDVIVIHSPREEDHTVARDYYTQANEKANRIAQIEGMSSWVKDQLRLSAFNLGYMYHFGHGVSRDLTVAKKFYLESIPPESHGQILIRWFIDWLLLEEQPMFADETPSIFSDIRITLLSIAIGAVFILLFWKNRMV
jgi:TPR repeat protein